MAVLRGTHNRLTLVILAVLNKWPDVFRVLRSCGNAQYNAKVTEVSLKRHFHLLDGVRREKEGMSDWRVSVGHAAKKWSNQKRSPDHSERISGKIGIYPYELGIFK